MKIPGYDPKHSLYFKRYLKKLDKENTNSHLKSKSSYLDGGEGEPMHIAKQSALLKNNSQDYFSLRKCSRVVRISSYFNT